MAAKAPVVLAVKQLAEFHCSFRRQAQRHAGLHGWRVQFITYSKLQIYNIVAKFNGRAGVSPIHYPQRTW